MDDFLRKYKWTHMASYFAVMQLWEVFNFIWLAFGPKHTHRHIQTHTQRDRHTHTHTHTHTTIVTITNIIVIIIGSNGQEYMFLLKGHEDLRQDERVMQLFGLVNLLLLNNPDTFRRNLT